MVREFWLQLEYPSLAIIALVLGLASLPSLARFAIGEDFKRARENLGFANSFYTQLTLLRLVLHGNWMSLRPVVFFGGYLIASGAIYSVLARIARLVS
ncbi:MAG: hypothetical protein MUF07_10700 [Steroidobacteraceae bacterium]|jgi:hypothetical protein|nr:hypothetical protein [Steroidobacteraceae bacterium]